MIRILEKIKEWNFKKGEYYERQKEKERNNNFSMDVKVKKYRHAGDISHGKRKSGKLKGLYSLDDEKSRL